MWGSGRSLLGWLLALGVCLRAPLAAQIPAVAAGSVVVARGTDSTPVPSARVLLHRVGRAAQGPVDSTRTDRSGRFRFRFAADTGSVYLVSATYGGIEYFSPPVHLNPARPDTALRVVVSDTSRIQPIELEARHIVIAAPKQDGTRSVLDLLVLRNPGDRTRISADSLHPAWQGPLPKGSFGLEVGEGDYSSAAVVRRGDRIAFIAPIAPGEKQVVVNYALQANVRDVLLPMEQPAALVNVLLQERNAKVLTRGLAPADSELIQGKTYYRWSGSLKAGDTLRIRLPGGAGPAPRWLLPVLVALVAAALSLAAWRLLPGARGDAVPPNAPPHPDPAAALLDAIAALDARYAGHEAETDPAEWQRYRGERAELKVRLEAALAPGHRGS